MRNYIYLNGDKVEISDETAQNFRVKFAAYQFKHGDICITENKERRLIVRQGSDLVSYDNCESKISTGQSEFVKWGYKKIGNVFENAVITGKSLNIIKGDLR